MKIIFEYKNGVTIRKNISYYSKYKILYDTMFYRDLMSFGNSLGYGKCLYVWIPKSELNSAYGVFATNSLKGEYKK